MLKDVLKNSWGLFYRNIINYVFFLLLCLLLLMFSTAFFSTMFYIISSRGLQGGPTELNIYALYIALFVCVTLVNIGLYNSALLLHRGESLRFFHFFPLKKIVKGFVVFTAFVLAVASIPLLFSVLTLMLSHGLGDGVEWVRMLIGILNVSQIFIAVFVWWRYSFALPAFLDTSILVPTAFEKSIHISRKLNTTMITTRTIIIVACFLVSVTGVGIFITLPILSLSEVWFYNQAKKLSAS